LFHVKIKNKDLRNGLAAKMFFFILGVVPCQNNNLLMIFTSELLPSVGHPKKLLQCVVPSSNIFLKFYRMGVDGCLFTLSLSYVDCALSCLTYGKTSRE